MSVLCARRRLPPQTALLGGERHAAGVQMLEQAGRFCERLAFVAHAPELLVPELLALGCAEALAEPYLNRVVGECDDLVLAHADVVMDVLDQRQDRRARRSKCDPGPIPCYSDSVVASSDRESQCSNAAQNRSFAPTTGMFREARLGE